MMYNLSSMYFVGFQVINANLSVPMVLNKMRIFIVCALR